MRIIGFTIRNYANLLFSRLCWKEAGTIKSTVYFPELNSRFFGYNRLKNANLRKLFYLF